MSKSSIGQNFTGRYEGIMDDEYLQVNIEQRGAELCGFTYDSVLNKPHDYCKARFEGRYDQERQAVFLSGVQFFANSGNHVLMRIKLWREAGDPPYILHAIVAAKSFMGSFFGNVTNEFLIRRVSSQPFKIPTSVMPPCFPEVEKKKPVAEKPVIAKKIPPVKRPVPMPIPQKPKDSIPVAKTIIPKPLSRDSIKILKTLPQRKKNEQARVTVNVPLINLKIFDNGIVDDDSVSVYYDGKLLVSHQRLSEKPIELNLTLEENSGPHELVMFAENLGSIPPNTALIIVTAGDKRYELHSKANLEENAVLVFEFKKE
jgi:hypothetical protein